jgi:hypothetical protein
MGQGGKDYYGLLCIYAQEHDLKIEAEWVQVQRDDSSWAYILRVGRFKVIGYCEMNNPLGRIETKDRVCTQMWGLLRTTNKMKPQHFKLEINQTKGKGKDLEYHEVEEEWVDWGRKNILEKYPKAKVNDKNYLVFPPTSLIMVFEFGFYREPFMVILMDPRTKEIHLFPYVENQEAIREILQDPEIEKAVFHKPYLENAFQMKLESTRDLIPDAERHYHTPLPNVGNLLKVQYKQSFTFKKQYRRWVESDSQTWSPNHIDTGALQAIAMYELIENLRENPPQKKRRLH